MKPENILELTGQVGGALVLGFVKGLANDAEHEAYEQEINDSKHSEENVPTHVAHTVGRFFGSIVKNGSN